MWFGLFKTKEAEPAPKYRLVPGVQGGWYLEIYKPEVGRYRTEAYVRSEAEGESKIANLERPIKVYD